MYLTLSYGHGQAKLNFNTLWNRSYIKATMFEGEVIREKGQKRQKEQLLQLFDIYFTVDSVPWRRFLCVNL